jgi:hypothetical protein
MCKCIQIFFNESCFNQNNLKYCIIKFLGGSVEKIIIYATSFHYKMDRYLYLNRSLSPRFSCSNTVKYLVTFNS